MSERPKIDTKVFFDTEREPVERSDLEAAMRQVMTHPAKSATGSENREPTREELNRRWKMTRR